MQAIVFEGAGGNEVLRVVERAVPEPGPGEVLVRVRRVGLNPADIAQREGRYPPPAGAPTDIGGIEVAGTVERCGPGVVRWRTGDRVFGLVDGGGFAERVLALDRCLAPVPDEMGDDEAAAAPEAFITAHDALRTVGRLRPGDRVLVNGANGAVGAAALQLVAAFGGFAVGTSRSSAGLEFIRSLGAGAVPQDDLLHGDPERLGLFDLVIELVGGANLARLPLVLAPRGRIVIVGVPAGDEMSLSVRSLMRLRASLTGTNLRNRPPEEKALAVQAFAHEVVPLLAGRLVAHLEACFPHTEAAAAFDHLASSGKRGKVLLSFPDEGSSDGDGDD
ncbi:alcohol dehydrogenase catalytic domain-containing protein [Blastococcus mobilis]|uniref:NADPH:quinone reductase n=1 Tax=Blastococcus mobilis TaxID=1938746 RepID=A0A238Y3V6_9ACTN|nr:zinc-binding dehydrogenase [Blastococcus mobilis]SNR65343.1 NADPH:quinone reductase [Blastococcus mobilis]